MSQLLRDFPDLVRGRLETAAYLGTSGLPL